ncbi:MAG: peptide ABC transporter substrate-binding protein [Planctomycetales bacterium]|nr:peptide ABC transporter substrate-binding protein [Planctomycetales bacterium]
MPFRISLRIATIGLMVAVCCLPGCRRPVDPEAEEETLVIGNLLAPFDPPALEALEKTVADSGGWVDRDVLDGIALLRERQKGEPQLATVEDALKMKNDTDEENDKIKDAMGRLWESEDQIDYEAEIARHTPQSLKNTNPLLGSSTTEFEVSSLTSFGLFGFDWNFKPFASADAVKTWQTSKNGMYEKVVMRDDLVWSDGTAITAHDIEFSFKVIMTEQVPIPAMRTGTDKLAYVKAYDDTTLVFFHKEALETNVWNINFGVIPKHVYEKSIQADPTLVDSEHHVAMEEKPVTGGPYAFRSRSQTEIVLERRDDYFMHNGKQVRDKPPFKTVRMRINPDNSTALLAMKVGDIDVMMLEAGQWSSETNDADFYAQNTKARAIEWVTFSFQWNTKSPYFDDVRVRQALGHAFDHKELLETLRYGRDEPCTGTFHKTSRWHPGPDNAVKNVPQPYHQNVEKAKQLLADAGWTDTDGDGYLDKQIDGKTTKFEFTILVRNQKERVDICELLKENLRPLGIVCNIRPLESATLQDKMLNKQFDAAYGGWGTGADPDTSENIWGTGQERNYCSYSNPVVDEMFAQGRTLADQRKLWKDLLLWKDEATRKDLGIDESLANERPTREDCYACIQAILYRDQPYTWLYYRNSYYAFNKNLRGYTFSPRGPFGFSPGFSSVWTPQH